MPQQLGSFDEGSWKALLALGRVRRYGRGRVLTREGDRSTDVLVLVDGRVKIVVASPAGRDVVLAVKGPGELFGEYAALDERPRSATVIAIDDVEAAHVAAPEFVDFLERHPRVGLGLLRSLANQLREEARGQAERDASDVTARVARRLVDLGDRFGEANGTTLAIPLTLSQEDLASWVGATREATNRALASLRRAGCVVTGRQRITITDLPGLRLLSV